MVAPGTLDELIDRYGLDLTPGDLLAELDATLARLTTQAPLTDSEVEFLSAHAGPGAAQVIASWDSDRERNARMRVALASTETLLANSVSPQQAARVLGVDRSQISRRLTSGTLYSYLTTGRRHRVPRWQFAGGHLLPGIETIVPAIPASLDPLSIEAFMRAPQPECGNRSPIEHLAAGGDASVVAALVASLDRW